MGQANVTERPCVRACMKNPSPTPDRSWARSTLTHRSGRAIAHFSSVQEGCARAYVPASLTLVSSCGSSHHGCIITISLPFSPACVLRGGFTVELLKDTLGVVSSHKTVEDRSVPRTNPSLSSLQIHTAQESHTPMKLPRKLRILSLSLFLSLGKLGKAFPAFSSASHTLGSTVKGDSVSRLAPRLTSLRSLHSSLRLLEEANKHKKTAKPLIA